MIYLMHSQMTNVQLVYIQPQLVYIQPGIPLCNQQALEQEESDVKNNRKGRLLYNLSTKDLPWLIGNSASQRSRFNFWLRTISRSSSLPFLLTNSFPHEVHDPTSSPAPPLSTAGPDKILPIGPLLSTVNTTTTNRLTMWDEDATCTEWLDQHPPLSVIYVSFGSWVPPVRHDKVAELAHALESANAPFLWSLRSDSAWRSGLPKGFLEGGRGKIVSWAPQEEVLAHEAVGCYVTHCGWNSIVEGIRHGKRFLCYPIAGDQFLNCHFITRVWGVGANVEGLGRTGIRESIERVMAREEGREMQEKVVELRERMMGSEGKSKARDNLQLFVDAVWSSGNKVRG